MDDDLGRVPSPGEMAEALWNRKAAGSSGILPEMLNVGQKNDEFVGVIGDMIKTVWEKRHVLKKWVDAILILIPKKGNLRSCDNWRCTALLEVVGK